MELQFSKYHGTGNDFIMINNLDGTNNLSVEQIANLCDRRFGVGADGLILLNSSVDFSFEMDYYNADGSKSFCGNGARCAVQFFKDLGNDISSVKFLAIDGEHRALVQGNLISIKMKDVTNIQSVQSNFVLDTGSPHYVSIVDHLNDQIVDYGRAVRYSSMFEKDGINVNQVEILDDKSIRIRTYERGVEDETLSCGTGATACAIVYGNMYLSDGDNEVAVKVEGGELRVKYSKKGSVYTNVELIGPAQFVFKGEMDYV